MGDPFAEFSDAERAELSKWVTDHLHSFVLSEEILDVLAVLCGEKSGAYVAVVVDTETGTPILGQQYVDDTMYEAEQTDLIGEFCDKFNLAYRRASDDWGNEPVYVETGSGETELTRVEATRYRYYIAQDKQRVSCLSEPPEDRDLGEFLGYPDEAIDAYVNGRSRWKKYRTYVRGLYTANSSPRNVEYIRYFDTPYAAAPTAKSLGNAWGAGRDRIEFREAVDEALDVENLFSLQFYRKTVLDEGYHFDNPRLLWWLFYYSIRDELSRPQEALSRLARYIDWRVSESKLPIN